MKQIVLSVVTIGAIVATSCGADGAEKCVLLDPSVLCSSATNIDYGHWGSYHVSWSANCGSAPNRVHVRGIGVCSSTPHSARGDYAETIQVADDLEFTGTSEDKYCWCKMTAPVESKWISPGTANPEACAQSCAGACDTMMWDGRGFLSVMFNSDNWIK